MIGIVSYGSGNIAAIANSLKMQNIAFEIITSAARLRHVTKIILPGVGAFDRTMELLEKSGFEKALRVSVEQYKVPILGICVGMQVMARGSEEGALPGFGWFDVKVTRISCRKPTSRVLPHMGWNGLSIEKETGLFQGIDLDEGFYFLHSYALDCTESPELQIASVEYGSKLCAAACEMNIYGVQFHPEKSHENGMKLLSNFVGMEHC